VQKEILCNTVAWVCSWNVLFRLKNA
jgi:hypothetical protein